MYSLVKKITNERQHNAAQASKLQTLITKGKKNPSSWILKSTILHANFTSTNMNQKKKMQNQSGPRWTAAGTLYPGSTRVTSAHYD